jgi:hypothetical protein
MSAAMNEKRQIFLHTLTGKKISFDLTEEQSVEDLMLMVQKTEGIPVDQQRIVFAGKQLEEERLLFTYNIQNGSTLHLVLRLRGMISSLTTQQSPDDPSTPFLFGSGPAPSKQVLLHLAKTRYNLRPIQLKGFGLVRDCPILSPAQRQLCIDVAHRAWMHYGPALSVSFLAPVADFKLVFTEDAIRHVLSVKAPDSDAQHNPNAFDDLIKLHPFSNEAKIAIRCTRGPVEGAIGWHCDGGYANFTIQLTLNDDSEYKGGRLCYFTPEKGVEVLERKAGTLTTHCRRVLHSVTRLTSGTRYSLFVVDKNNGLGDSGVIVIDIEDVLHFLSPPQPPQPAKRNSLCEMCFQRDADVVLLPCRHLCMCQECVAPFDEVDDFQCPVCDVVKAGSLKINLKHP